MPTLDWIGKDKVINHHMEVPYRVLDEQYSYGEDSENMIIHGDNLSALKSLLPQYEGKIKCIYIDPPYNTGNEGWVYNDNVNDPRIKKWLGEVVGTEGVDLSRHDKWLCMMYPRLKLLHRLLADDGAIFISIDDNEQANLKLICDEIFGKDNYIAQFTIASNSAKNNSKFVSVSHEYLLCYVKDKKKTPPNWSVSRNNIDDFKKIAKKLLKSGMTSDEMHSELLSLVKYPKYYEFDHYTYVDKRGVFRASDLTAPGSKLRYNIIHPITKKICKIGTRGWAYSEDELQKLIDNDYILFGKDETVIPQLKNYLFENEKVLPKSILFFDSQSSTKWIKSQNFEFDYPKAIDFIEYVISMYPKDDMIILDSFAGSGTTAHAVLNMNKADGGNRKFILIEMCDYAETITAERVKRVIDGYGEGKKKVDGAGGGFTFYELGEKLLDGEYLNENIGTEKIREYVYFTETKQPIENKDEEPYFMGKYLDTAYYFYYEKDAVTTLDRAFLHMIKTKSESYLIYADKCIISDEELEKNHIKFKKIPRDITRL